MKYLIFSIIVFCAISCTGPNVKVQRYAEAERDSLLAVVESLSVQIGSMQEQMDANDSLTGVTYMLALQADSNSKNAILGVNKITKKDILFYKAGKVIDGLTGRKISQAAELLR